MRHLEVEAANATVLRAKAEILAKQGNTEELEVVLTQLEAGFSGNRSGCLWQGPALQAAEEVSRGGGGL